MVYQQLCSCVRHLTFRCTIKPTGLVTSVVVTPVRCIVDALTIGYYSEYYRVCVQTSVEAAASGHLG